MSVNVSSSNCLLSYKPIVVTEEDSSQKSKSLFYAVGNDYVYGVAKRIRPDQIYFDPPLDFAGKHKRSILSTAAEKGALNVVEYLIDIHRTPVIQDDAIDGVNPPLIAATWVRLDPEKMVRLLISKKADVNCSLNGRHILEYAENETIRHLLLQSNADVTKFQSHYCKFIGFLTLLLRDIKFVRLVEDYYLG